jgi:hypothetical protein
MTPGRTVEQWIGGTVEGQMPDVSFRFDQIPRFARAMRFASEPVLVSKTAGALIRMGRADIEKMKTEQLSGGRLNVRFKGFRNSFKSKLLPQGKAQKIDQLQLSEYTGAKPFGIFQTGGIISPSRRKVLTVLAPGGRNAAGRRKFPAKDSLDSIRAKIKSGELVVIQTRGGAVVATPQFKATKRGTMRRTNKVTVVAFLRPSVNEKQRIDFFGNFEANASEHERILGEAADAAIVETVERE